MEGAGNMATPNLHIPDDLLTELQAKAASLGTTADEMAAEAVRESLRKEMRDKSWQGLLVRGRRRGAESGITEEQVPDVVRQYRAEHRRP
jgi:hypothetical protein